MAPSSPRAEVWDLMVADTDFLECGICFLPLKPPIFQCAVGHVVCSPCLEKLKVNDAAGKCHVCGVAMAGGYQRCHAMERAVDAVRAAPAYHAREDHLRACHCPGEACGFVGSTAALLDHVSGAHGWPVHTQHPGLLGTVAAVCLRDGFNFVVVADEHGHGRREHLVLLNVARHPFWRAVSVVCVCPRSAARLELATGPPSDVDGSTSDVDGSAADDVGDVGCGGSPSR
ncbi:hypothetical protein U9M48_042021 [Paspalum notatum var. saurae]|uniref:E3 ubiquitin-protein ligase Sina-like RING finger domain-containing protein n=1 Tax=Paspalum notatum var. saurae TaxID=547442 RepID=A0AAQ3XFH9_PASNO